MSGVAQNAEQEFWRPPVAPVSQGTGEGLVEACGHCAAEFVPGAAFCHVCGTARQNRSTAAATNWLQQVQSWVRPLEFHRIKERLGLPAVSLVAFFAGFACLLAAFAVGFIFTATTVLDWQAVQIWRIEWLLASAAAFLAGILLKR